MTSAVRTTERRTSVDVVFDSLYNAIVTLEMLPGDKISEAEIAAQFGVSRQPVRDAFSRLANLGLLLIQPQKATEVKRFSRREIEKSRFVRVCVESEVMRRAALGSTAEAKIALDANLALQALAVEARNYEKFSKHDYAFHDILCKTADVDFAFEVISLEKASVDRLCMLSLSKEDRMPELLVDHTKIAACVVAGDAEGAVEIGRIHLSRLNATIDAIFRDKPEYFEA